MGVHARAFSCLVLAGGLAIGGVAVASGASAATTGHHHSAYVCSGTFDAPGVLTGFHKSDVIVKGVCAVNAGRAFVRGDLTIRPGAALLAAFALNDQTGKGSSSLAVAGDLRVGSGGAAVLGCLASSFPCLDDPNPDAPTLASHPRVFGDLTSSQPLGVIVHNASIYGDVTHRGGGGGLSCDPTGIFAQFGSPAYTDYEDSTIGGHVRVTGVQSCWMGVIRDHVGGSVVLRNNQLADPDAIEVLSNHIRGDLVCRGNSMVWDNADITENLFPRQPEPNTVKGDRKGQCVLSSPDTETDTPGPGPF
jgi:hypothetical protein